MNVRQPSHGHFITVCSCGAIISQCRCPDPNKTRTVVDRGCQRCKGETALKTRQEIEDEVRAEVEARIAADVRATVLDPAALTVFPLEELENYLVQEHAAVILHGGMSSPGFELILRALLVLYRQVNEVPPS